MPIKRFDLNSSGCERMSPRGAYVFATEHEAQVNEAARIIRKCLLEGRCEPDTIEAAQKWLSEVTADKVAAVVIHDCHTCTCDRCVAIRKAAGLTIEDYQSVVEGLALTDDPKNETSTLLDRIAEREATRKVAERFGMDPLHVAHDIITYRLKVGDDSGWALNAAYAFADKLRSKPTVTR